MTIRVVHAHGLTETHADLEAALASLRKVYGPAIATEGLENLPLGTALVWRSDDDAENDDGALACARLRESVADEGYSERAAAAAARQVDKRGFNRAACDFSEETGTTIEADVRRLLLGLSPAELLAECLDGADNDRIEGAKAYAAAVIACAERARLL